jgi:alpha-glucosidase
VCHEYDHVGGPVGEGPSAADRERVLLGEVFGTPTELRRFLADGDGLQLVFLFDFLTARYDAGWLSQRIDAFERAFPHPDQPTYVLENHDRTRLVDRLGGDVRKARVMATVLLTVRGVPTVYQGQEIGQSNTPIPLADAQDPIVRTYFPWLPEAVNRRLPERPNRDEVRTPMQWDAGPNAGFCPPDVRPWLPVNDDRTTANVADQRQDPASLLELYRSLLAVRRSHPALHAGRLDLVPGAPDGTVAWLRSDAGERVLVGANLSGVEVDLPLGAGRGDLLVATEPDVGVDTAVRLPPHSAAVVLLDPPG